MKTEGLENLTLTRHNESSRNMSKQNVISLTSLHEWMAESGKRRDIKETQVA